MEVLKDKVGTVVANDGLGLAVALGVTDIWHAGNFKFGAKLWGVEVDIITEPVDTDARELRVISVRMEDKVLQKEGIYRNKVGFYYRMVKGRSSAESYIELPVSEARYKELFFGMADTDSKVYDDVRSVLKNLVKLQGYDKLIGFDPEFTIETREDEE